ncbi:chemotaxis protein CheA [Mangrovitalea sediminis]|uniref:chemotaxis protein CheA n=1 Tax=Mangrovitalea sediminis TaxID=1982043 RepID=UPI000BE4F6CB|nr:chemotaxis protein CheA [Mangrovitalea sediminis]
MSIDMRQFHDSFFEESAEHLDEMERILMQVDLESPSADDLDSIFRAAHSIKGGSGIFGFDALGVVTHVMENLLDKVRAREMALESDLVEILLRTGDTLRTILGAYRGGESIPWTEVNQATEALEKVLKSHDGAPVEEPDVGSTPPETVGYGFFPAKPQPTEDDGFGFFEPDTAAAPIDEGFGFFDELPSGASPVAPESGPGFGFFGEEGGAAAAGSDSIAHPTKGIPPKADREAPGNAGDGEAESAVGHQKSVSPPVPKTSGGPSKTSAEKSLGREKRSSHESTSIRVDTLKVDQLINLVGELVITQSMLLDICKDVEGHNGERLERVLGELVRNTRELQESVMSVRMLPISFAFSRFPRVVRDLAGKLGKSIDLIVEGSETELDKGLIEKLVDPLTHLVRNSVDHGIETREARKAAGKPEKGNVVLRALQQGGNVVIEVADDGGGLDREKIIDKAIQRGLPLPDNPSDRDVWQLIMAPGFSTATVVTEVSGRGVGMDVVKRNIEALGGRLDILSAKGQGTTFSIHLPLTLAIVDGLCVLAGDQTFIIPLVNIIESMAPDAGSIKTLAGQDKLLSVRNHYWPVVALGAVMQVEKGTLDAEHSIMVLVEAGRRRFALQVDELVGQQQVVIKSLEQHYRRVSGVAGATILGDGGVALILDIEALAEHAISSETMEASTV